MNLSNKWKEIIEDGIDKYQLKEGDYTYETFFERRFNYWVIKIFTTRSEFPEVTAAKTFPDAVEYCEEDFERRTK